MAIVTPPPTTDTDERTLDERVAELEALIEEARLRARRRRRRNTGIALAVGITAGAALFTGGGGPGLGTTRTADGDAAPATTLDRVGVWSTPTGPPGVSGSVVLHPSRPGWLYLYAKGHGGRVFRSTDGGRSWKSGSPVAARIDALVIDPRRGSILYLGTSNGVLKSTDVGRTWRRSGLPPERRWHANLEGYVHSIAFDAADSRILYATGGSDLYRSNDAGSTWHILPRSAPQTSLDEVHAAAAPGVLYATMQGWGATGPAILRSTDGGLTWQRVLEGFWDVTVDPVRKGTVWATRRGGIRVTRDGGSTWREPGRTPAGDLNRIVLDPRHPDTLYVDGGRVLRSTDAGRSWQSFGTGLTGMGAIDPREPGTIYANDGYGVVKTVDGGATWRRADAGMVATSVNAIVAAPSKPARLYVGGENLFRSDDRGRTWTGLRAGFVSSALAVDPRDHRHVLVAPVSKGIVASRDGGATWTTAKLPGGLGTKLRAGGGVQSLAFDTRNPLVVYAGLYYKGAGGLGLIRSGDGGKTWRWVQGGPRVSEATVLAVHPDRAGTVYASGRGGIFARSANGGTSWRRSRILPRTIVGDGWVESLTVAPSDSDTLYVASGYGLARSVDGGAHWRLLPELNRAAAAGIERRAIAVDPKRADTIYVGTVAGRVLRSTNGGKSWRPFGKGLPKRSIQTLVFDPTGTWLYAGPADAGLTATRVR